MSIRNLFIRSWNHSTGVIPLSFIFLFCFLLPLHPMDDDVEQPKFDPKKFDRQWEQSKRILKAAKKAAVATTKTAKETAGKVPEAAQGLIRRNEDDANRLVEWMPVSEDTQVILKLFIMFQKEEGDPELDALMRKSDKELQEMYDRLSREQKERTKKEREEIRKKNSFLWRWEVLNNDKWTKIANKLSEWLTKMQMADDNEWNGRGWRWPTQEEYEERVEERKERAERELERYKQMEEERLKQLSPEERYDEEETAHIFKKVCKEFEDEIEQGKKLLEEAKSYQNFSIGFYREDVFRLAFLVGTQALDWWFYKNLKKKRLENILEKFENNPEDMLKVLNDLYDDPEAEDYLNRDSWGLCKRMKKFFSRIPKRIKELRKYIAKNHDLVGFNPLNSKTLGLNAKMILGQEVALKMQESRRPRIDGLEEQDIIKVIDSVTSFEKDEQGEYKRVGFGLSVVTILTFLLNPCSTTIMALLGGSKMQVKALRNTAFLGSLFEYKQPWIIDKILKSPLAPFLLRLFIHFSAVKIFDRMCRDLWLNYVFDNSGELKQLLENYSKAKKRNDKEQVKELKESLKDFIEEGHREIHPLKTKSWYKWFTSRAIARNYQTSILFWVIVAPVIYKGIRFGIELCEYNQMI